MPTTWRLGSSRPSQATCVTRPACGPFARPSRADAERELLKVVVRHVTTGIPGHRSVPVSARQARPPANATAGQSQPRSTVRRGPTIEDGWRLWRPPGYSGDCWAPARKPESSPRWVGSDDNDDDEPEAAGAVSTDLDEGRSKKVDPVAVPEIHLNDLPTAGHPRNDEPNLVTASRRSRTRRGPRWLRVTRTILRPSPNARDTMSSRRRSVRNLGGGGSDALRAW